MVKTVKSGGDRVRILAFEYVQFWGDDATGDWTPYMQKWGLHIGPLGSIWVHHFYRGDVDRDLHDHPWPFVTFPLTPYVEEVAQYPRGGLPMTCEICELPDMEHGCCFCALSGLPNPPELSIQVVEAFRFHYRPAKYQHRVLHRWTGVETSQIWPDEGENAPESVENGAKTGIWTLVWHAKKTRNWGFLKLRDGRWCW